MPSGTTRFLDNFTTSGLASCAFYRNGGSSTPDYGVDPNYGVANLLNPDRYAMFSCIYGGIVLYDLGGSKTALYLGGHNLDAGASAFPYQFQFYSSPAAATLTVTTCATAAGASVMTRSAFDFAAAGVVLGMMVKGAGADTFSVVTSVAVGSVGLNRPAAGGAGTASFYGWTLQATPNFQTQTGGGRDTLYTLPTPVTARYWRVVPQSDSGGWAIGSLFVGGNKADLGFSFSPTTGGRYVRALVSAPSVSDLAITNETGRPHKEFALKFLRVKQATFDQLLAQAASAPFTMLDAYGATFQAMMSSPMEWDVEFGVPDLYNVTFPIRVLQ